MGVASTISSHSFVSSGALTAVSIPFPFAAAADVLSFRVNADGSETALVRGTDFSITGDGRATTGTYTPLVVVTAGLTVRLRRQTALTQSYRPVQGQPPNAAATEAALDDVVMAVQDQARENAQAFRAYGGETPLPVASLADADGMVLGVVDNEIVPIPNTVVNATAQAAAAANARVAAEEARDDAEDEAAAALTNKNLAVAQATAAGVARLAAEDALVLTLAAALALDNVYPNTTDGLAGVSEGGYFAVPGTGTTAFILYRDLSGVAVEQFRTASLSASVREAGVNIYPDDDFDPDGYHGEYSLPADYTFTRLFGQSTGGDVDLTILAGDIAIYGPTTISTAGIELTGLSIEALAGQAIVMVFADPTGTVTHVFVKIEGMPS